MSEAGNVGSTAMPTLHELLALADMPFNRDLLARTNPVLTRETLTPESVPGLSDLFVPWHRRDGIPVIHTHGADRALFPRVVIGLPKCGDVALTIGEVAASAEPAHPWFKPESILQDPRATGWYPAYNVGNGRRLLLDGNHRCISLARSAIDYRIDLIVINGPVRGDILSDLAVFG